MYTKLRLLVKMYTKFRPYTRAMPMTIVSGHCESWLMLEKSLIEVLNPQTPMAQQWSFGATVSWRVITRLDTNRILPPDLWCTRSKSDKRSRGEKECIKPFLIHHIKISSQQSLGGWLHEKARDASCNNQLMSNE